MRLVTTLAYGFAAALVFVIFAAALIGTPAPGPAHGGLTSATILRSDGSRADAPPTPSPAEPDRPSS